MEYRSRNVLLATFVAFALVALTSHARTWNVRPDASGDAPTIQAAMDSAASGDLVLLAPGTYTWTSQNTTGTSMIHISRDVALRGALGAAATVLDGEGQGRVILVASGVTAEIEGLTITRGRVADLSSSGGGIRADAGSELRISNCIVRDNIADVPSDGWGGGIYCDKATIADCEISHNFSTVGGGVLGASITLSNCSLRRNRAAGHSYGFGGGVWAKTGTITDCWFEDNSAGRSQNSGGGVLFKEGGAIVRCTFVNNNAALGGAVVCESGCTIDASIFVGNAADAEDGYGGAIVGYGGEVTVSHCTLVGNRDLTSGDLGPLVGGIAIQTGSVSRCIITGSEGLAVWGFGACATGPTVSSCNFYGNSAGDTWCGVDGGDNFSADPEFCAVDPSVSLLFTLQADSPCATRYAPMVIGAAPVGCGSVSALQRSWSAVKSLYRGTHRRVEP